MIRRTRRASERQTKHIFVTGGVVSSLGKGLTAATIGMLLEKRGLRVAMQKIDPYINVDPGTMSPFQHGEVYVLDDGTEADLDLGHYERFTHGALSQKSAFTTGRVYQSVIQKERRGDYLGQTVQVVPHITDEIKYLIRNVCDDVDVVISELGGTVGDIEGLPFLEAIRQLGFELGRTNTLFVHLTLLPYLSASGEVKTKPTQHSVQKMREIGVQPDILVCRTERDVSDEALRKISLFCNVDLEAVFVEKDVETSIYEIPLILREQGLDRVILKYLDIDFYGSDFTDWQEIVNVLKKPEGIVEIAVVGKYIALQDAYKSIYESLVHAGLPHKFQVKVRRVGAEQLEQAEASLPNIFQGVHGILVPGGFGTRGVEGKIKAIQYARENQIPFFGICLGMQLATVEFARNVVGLDGAHSGEFDEGSKDRVIDLMAEQKDVLDKGGTMRLGAYPCDLLPGSKVRDAYQKERITERHRHRYEFNNAYRDSFESHGLVFSGLSPDRSLVEIVELEEHPWFVGCQFHPEFQSKPTAPHALFKDFFGAAIQCKSQITPCPL
jgi:CTP synthase